MAGRGKKKRISPEDMAKAEEYALQGCKNNTIATLMQWGHNFIDDRPDIRKRLTLKRAERDQKLRKLQFEHAEKYAPMAMFLGKNYLGQADRQERKHGFDEETASLLSLIDGETKGVLPSQERGGAEGETEMEV